MDEERQAHLLEGYIAQLRINPDAPPPPDLDPETARTAKGLYLQAQMPVDVSQKARVWDAMMSHLQTEMSFNQHHNRKEVLHMIATQPLPKQQKAQSQLAWLAVACIILALAGSVLLVMTTMRPNNSTPYAAGNVQQEQRVTPVPPLDIEGYLPVVTAYITIPVGTVIREDMLTITYWQADRAPSNSFGAFEEVVGKIATTQIERFLPLLNDAIADEATLFPMFLTPTLVPPTQMDNSHIDPLFQTATAIVVDDATMTFAALIQPTAMPTLTPTITPSPTYTSTLAPTSPATPTTTPTMTSTPTLRP